MSLRPLAQSLRPQGTWREAIHPETTRRSMGARAAGPHLASLQAQLRLPIPEGEDEDEETIEKGVNFPTHPQTIEKHVNY